ncbi:MAG: phosphate ABC transporter substrate-binding protein [Polyangiaceae bacterium]|nr:phosphate ABC transporter substrate-binding protein [Polyangiaceae bacterium]
MIVRHISTALVGLVAALALGACSRRTQPQGEGQATGTAAQGDRVVIQNKGSDTLVNVAQAWAEEYKKVKPSVAVAVTGGGSGTGISALINGTVQIANASRAMKDKELEAAKAKGFAPVQHVVGYDALAVFVHKDNPKREVTVEELKEIYAEGGKVDKWSQLGIKVPGCPSDEIVRVSRQNNSGTYAYFKEAIIGEKGEYKLGSRDMNGSKDVVDLVEKTPCAVGYSGLAYATENVRVLCVKTGDQCVAPSEDAALDGSYPIARPLFMYTPGEATGAVKDYLDWILGDQGQCIIKEKGYSPVKKLACK